MNEEKKIRRVERALRGDPTNLRGEDFTRYVVKSYFHREMKAHGFVVDEISEWELEKDYGDGAIAYFACGYIKYGWSTGDRRFEFMLHQSRLSDAWALDGPMGRTESTRGLADLRQMDDPEFVKKLIAEAIDQVVVKSLQRNG